ncbi:uncharacterized protein PAC_14416 [Phialocephala subalpina]|uniref:Helicase/UvrB N-terminal domain-containing protein n=1 Tax=Phialocephala subalpina TaxID=576137 RepID=A0A1L7XHM9_9HELO|nr:uncharacterized protein PAC_14416 [Phialocephala subalpina]
MFLSNRKHYLERLDQATDYKWRAKVIGIEPGIGTEYNIAFLATQPPGHPSIDTLAEHGYRAFFKFSRQPDYCQYILGSMDGVIFPASQPKTWQVGRYSIREILMGRGGHRPVPHKRMNADGPSVMAARTRMNAEQKEAFDELFKSFFTIVISPTGCGKTMLASTFCAACAQSGERVLVLASSQADLRQLHNLSISAANDLDVSERLTNGMFLVNTMSSIDSGWLSELLSKS